MLTILSSRQEIVENVLSDGQDLLGELGDEVLRELAQLVPFEAGERLGDGGAEAHGGRLVDAVEAERDHVRAPLGRRVAAALARHDLLPVEGDRGALQKRKFP